MLVHFIYVLVNLHKDCSHFWMLDSVEDIKDLATPGWGRSKGGVTFFGDGLVTDGVSGEVQLNHEGDTCATQIASYPCEDTGFTVALSIKPWNRDDGARQIFFKSLGKVVVYQEVNNKTLIIRVQRLSQYCLKEIPMPEKIWSHLVFSYKPRTPKILTVYRNGERIDKFIRDEGCRKSGSPEFSSTYMSLSAGDAVFARAHYSNVAIWKQVLTEERIAQIYSGIKGEGCVLQWINILCLIII